MASCSHTQHLLNTHYLSSLSQKATDILTRLFLFFISEKINALFNLAMYLTVNVLSINQINLIIGTWEMKLWFF